MSGILLPVLIVGGCGLLFGCLLAFASVIFNVAKDDRIERIEEALPGANCGACGFAGCAAPLAAYRRWGIPPRLEQMRRSL